MIHLKMCFPRSGLLIATITVLATSAVVVSDTHAQVPITIRRAEPQAEFQLEEVLSIGSLNGDKDAFGSVISIALDGRGRVLVVDQAARHFKVFDASGNYIATVGRKGEGPGEFASPWQIAVGPGDSVFVWDAGRAHISVFSSEYDWVRDIRVSPAWQINSIVPRQDGTLVVAAFGRGDRFPVKVLDSEGGILRTGGVPVDAPILHGFEKSLLGGRLTASPSGYVHTAKSPYVLSFLDEHLDPTRVCHGPSGLVTDPADVVDVTEHGVGIRWGDYVHTVSILPLGDGLFLNTIFNFGSDKRMLHVVNDRCELVAELEIDVPLIPSVSRGELVGVVRSYDYDEVVLYRMSLGESAVASR